MWVCSSHAVSAENGSTHSQNSKSSRRGHACTRHVRLRPAQSAPAVKSSASAPASSAAGSRKPSKSASAAGSMARSAVPNAQPSPATAMAEAETPARQRQSRANAQPHTINSARYRMAAGKAIYTPSRSNGGVYSSRALLFSCIKPVSSPRFSACCTTLRYSYVVMRRPRPCSAPL